MSTTDVDDLPEPPELDLGLDDMQLDTLAGDLRDAMLTRFKNNRKAWHELTEAEQNMLAEGVGQDAREIVRKAVGLLTAWEWPRVVARLGDMKIIGGEKTRIEAKLVASNIADYRDALGENVGSEVMILMVDSETFMNAKGPVETDPDQPALPIGQDEQDDDADEAAYQQAVEAVTSSGKASTSAVQRKLGIGYNKAARLIERMEREGVVSAPDRDGRRSVLAAEAA